MMVKYKEKFALASRPERHLAERLEASIPQPGQSLDYHDEHHVQRRSVQRGLKFSRHMNLYRFVIGDSFFLKTASKHFSSGK
ncbi:hypothetical protein N8616_04910 [Verrucomicrobia bacterium]|nr:hypothetical protein [Verrucomicrobiota bacterium]MDA7533679.1 hypothetical protein [Verrucomicrobiota bacterium]